MTKLLQNICVKYFTNYCCYYYKSCFCTFELNILWQLLSDNNLLVNAWKMPNFNKRSENDEGAIGLSAGLKAESTPTSVNHSPAHRSGLNLLDDVV